MTPTVEVLKEAHCFFAGDRAGGPEMTAFKQEARWRQHRWAVEELGIKDTEFGWHRGRTMTADGNPGQIPNGTKLRDADAENGLNFLSHDIWDVVQKRVEQTDDQVKHQTLDPVRLRRDLLSSMPMAFNLFAEASVPGNEISRRQLAELFGVSSDPPSDIVFEWSPERRSEKYTNDRTAFDVALRMGDPSGPRNVVGLETKYHEHSFKEGKSKPAGAQRHQDQTKFLVDKANSSGAFKPGWEESVLGTDLRQIWRDHLLALTMRDHPQEWTSSTRYVLVYPSRNGSFADAVGRYGALLESEDDSFKAFTIEEVLDASFAHGGPTKDLFRQRYLW